MTEDARLSVQWRLAFALRREYIAAQSAVYPGQYRLDASYLLVAGARVVREAFAADHADDSDRPMCVEALGLPGCWLWMMFKTPRWPACASWRSWECRRQVGAGRQPG